MYLEVLLIKESEDLDSFPNKLDLAYRKAPLRSSENVYEKGLSEKCSKALLL